MGANIKHRERQDAARGQAGSVELYRAALRVTLDGYSRTGEPSMLDQAFVVAAAAIEMVRGSKASQPCTIAEARSMMAKLPELAWLASVAVRDAERSLHARACALWEQLGVRTPPPSWHELERSEARALVASACAVLNGRSAVRLRSQLAALAAARWAAMLAAQLRADEDLWRVALGDRYPSVRRRYAARTRWRTEELSELVASDPLLAQNVHRRLARWLADSWDFSRFPAELEAAFAQTRTRRNSRPEDGRRVAHHPRQQPARTVDR